jgi:hypothetical protein
MDGTFACPECGCEIRLTGLSPGRTVPCDWCRTPVEVPFLPRADQIKRMRKERVSKRKRHGYRAWMGTGVAAFAVLIGLAAAQRVVRSRWQSADADALARMQTSSRSAEDSGRLGEALAELEGALTLAEKADLSPSERDELRGRRDRLARREAEAQLTALEGDRVSSALDPAAKVGRALTLAARVAKDPALRELDARVTACVERLRVRWVEVDDEAARVAESAGKAVESLELSSRQYHTASDLDPGLQRHWQSEAGARARRLIARYGAVIDPVRGHYTLGSTAAYDGALHSVVSSALKDAGYLPPPRTGPWNDLWPSLAPYRLSIEVTELQDDNYLSSPNKLSRLESVVKLSRQGTTFWTVQPLARTSVPVPGLPALQASRAGVSSHRSPEFERVLYENARSNLLERLGVTLRQLPSITSSRPIPSAN